MEAAEESDFDHFVGYLGLELWHEGDDETWGRATVRPEMWAPGTRRPRLGLLFTMADVVGGSRPTGILSPTVDLRIQLLGAAPSAGDIVMQSRPLKVGRRLWTGDVRFYSGAGSDPFARCEFSFMNQQFRGLQGPTGLAGYRGPGERALPASSFDELFRMRILDDGTLEMDPHGAVRNGLVGTIQGGAQATMAEIASERALAGRGRFEVCDLHLRYLSALKTGPAVARAHVLDGDEQRPVVQVSITDREHESLLVSTAVAVCRPELG